MSLTKAEFDQKFFELFRNDYLVDAYELYQSASTFHTVTTLSPTEVAEIESLEEVQVLKSDLEYGDQCLELLYSLDTWERVRDEGNIVTYCKGSGSTFMVACEMTVEQPIFPILALFLEIDLLTNLCELRRVPNLKEASCVYEPSKFRKLVRYLYEFPWPVSNREVVLECAGFPVAQSKSALLTLRSPTRPHLLGFPVPPETAGLVRCDVPMGLVNLMILEPELTQISMVFQLNPHVVGCTQPLIPKTVVNFVSKHAAYYMMEQVRNQLAAFKGSEYERRVKEKPYYYEDLRKRVQDYSTLLGLS